MNNELFELAAKAQAEGLTLDEKMRFNELNTELEPKCRCNLGDKCRLHGIKYEVMYEA